MRNIAFATKPFRPPSPPPETGPEPDLISKGNDHPEPGPQDLLEAHNLLEAHLSTANVFLADTSKGTTMANFSELSQYFHAIEFRRTVPLPTLFDSLWPTSQPRAMLQCPVEHRPGGASALEPRSQNEKPNPTANRE